MSNSKIISKQPVFKSKFYEINRTLIERDGKRITKDIIEWSSFVIILPINTNNEIYLVSQYRDAWQKTLLETVAGHMEKNETPHESAKRELNEETGIIAENIIQIGSFYHAANIKCLVHVFLATNLQEGKQNLDYDENIKIVKISFASALSKIDKGEIIVSSNIAAILLLDRLRKEGKIKI